jgi:syntaxin-binding protein 1
MLATCPAGPLVKSFQEMFLEFIPFEARAFHLNMPESFGRLLRSGAESAPTNIAELETMATRIVSLIVSLNEIPTIKYRATGGASPDSTGKLCSRLANLVQEGLDHYCSRNPSFRPSPGGDLIIMDRTVDLVSPLLHEFTYQAMAHDLLPIHHDNRYDYKFSSGAGGNSSTRTVALDENDSLWLSMRHTHIADCSKFIVNRFNEFVSENKAAVKQSSKTKGGGIV